MASTFLRQSASKHEILTLLHERVTLRSGRGVWLGSLRKARQTPPSRRNCSIHNVISTASLDDVFLKLAENKNSDAAALFATKWKDQRGADAAVAEILEGLKISPHQSEEFLKALESEGVKPKLEHYMVVLAGWLHFDPPSARRAQRLLDHMDNIGIEYDLDSCNLVLHSWARHNNGEGAEKLFEQMLSKNVGVSEDSFGFVLKAWSRSKSATAFKKADSILLRMKEYGLQPTIDCYLSTVSCWSKTKRKGSEQRLESLYREILATIKAQNADAAKVQQVILAVLQAYGSLENAHRAEDILLAFTDEYRLTNLVPPSLDMCLSVLSTWSKSKSSRRGARAEKLLSLMEKDDCLPNPDVACFTAVLNCLAGSNRPNSAQRAELLLRLMDDNPATQPNLFAYTCVINAWARSKHADAALETERLFQEMINRGIKSDRRVFAVLISAWSRSSREDAVEKAEFLFQRLQEINKASGDPSTMASVVEYTATMQAWANHVSRHIEKSREAVTRVENLLDEMIELNQDRVRPNSLTYAAVLKTIAAARRIPDRRERAERILRIMDSQGAEISPYIKNIVRKCRARE